MEGPIEEHEMELQALVTSEQLPDPHSSGPSLSSANCGPSQADKDHEGNIGECRICQEDDHVDNMDVPCDCAGTVKYAHHKCIQMWVNEKGNLKCEICGGTFKGDYTVPEPPQLRELNLEEALAAFPLLRPFRHHLLAHSGLELSRDLEVEADEVRGDYSNSRQLSATYCFAILLMILGMFTIHHTFSVIQDDVQQDDDPGTYNESIHYGAHHPSAQTPQQSAQNADMNLGVVLVWLILRLVMVVLPLALMMRVLGIMHAARRPEARHSVHTFDVARFLQELEEGSLPGAQQSIYQRGGAPSEPFADLPFGRAGTSAVGLQGAGVSVPSR